MDIYWNKKVIKLQLNTSGHKRGKGENVKLSTHHGYRTLECRGMWKAADLPPIYTNCLVFIEVLLMWATKLSYWSWDSSQVDNDKFVSTSLIINTSSDCIKCSYEY